MKQNSALRASVFAAPCMAALLLSACQGEHQEPSAIPVSPHGPSADAGPANAAPGPVPVAVNEAEFAALAKSAQAAGNCTVGFNDTWGLALLPDMARNTFALPNWYAEDCNGGGVRILENPSSRYGEDWGSDYGHYHLGYQRGDFCLTPDEFKAGIMTNGTCVEVAHPEREDRYLGSHFSDHWIRLYVFGPAPLGRPSPDLTFDFKGIRVKEGAKVRIYARKAAGGWLKWAPPGPGRWTINEGDAVREVLISAVNGENEPFFLDDFVVSVP